MIRTDAVTAADVRRGHSFYPSADEMASIPGLYETENTPLDDKIVHLHYFVGSADWLIVELNPDTGEAFGWAQLFPGCGEWGYIYLPELATTKIDGFLPLYVERDLFFTPQPASVAVPRYEISG